MSVYNEQSCNSICMFANLMIIIYAAFYLQQFEISYIETSALHFFYVLRLCETSRRSVPYTGERNSLSVHMIFSRRNLSVDAGRHALVLQWFNKMPTTTL